MFLGIPLQLFEITFLTNFQRSLLLTKLPQKFYSKLLDFIFLQRKADAQLFKICNIWVIYQFFSNFNKKLKQKKPRG